MEQFIVSILLILVLLALLASSLWIGLSLMLIGLITMEVILAKPAGDSMALTIWGSLSSWTLTALPLFIWMGEILFRGRLSEDLFRGLAPWLNRLPGRLLHVNVMGSTIFAAVSGSSAATCATVGRMTIPELRKRNYPEKMIVGSLAGSATLGFLIPPSIIMIVYGVAADVSIARLFIGGVLPGLLLASLFMGYVLLWAVFNPTAIPAAEKDLTLREKICAARHLIPLVLLIFLVLGSIYTGLATATEAAALGVTGALIISWWQKTLSWESFREGILAGARLYCMIALILAGSSFLTLAMGFIGLPRNLAAWIGALGLSSFELILVLTLFYLILGCFLDGISMVVLTMAVVLPTITQAGIDLLWFGIFIVLVVEMAQITPPVGFNLFVLQAMTKHQIIYIAKAALPFFFILLLAVLIIYFFPEIVTFLPSKMQLRA